MSKVIVYSTHCPKCKVLEKKLELANIDFEIVDDLDIMREIGMHSAPALQVNENTILNFKEALTWIKEKNNG